MIPAARMALPFSGTELVPFPFRFNFPLSESFAAVTDIISADDGSEQRVAVRNPARPRRVIAGTVMAFDRDEWAHLEALLFGNQVGAYGVPLWPDAMTLAANVTAGDRDLTVIDSDGRDLAQRLTDEEDVPCLLWRAHDDYRPFLIAAIDDGTLTATEPIPEDWLADGLTLVLPLQLMALSQEPAISRETATISQVALEFTSGQTPRPGNATDGTDDIGLHAQMVRPIGRMRGLATGTDHLLDGNDIPAHPVFADMTHDLFGYSTAVELGMVAGEGIVSASEDGAPIGPTDFSALTKAMYPSSKGRLSGFSKCTLKAPATFFTQIFGIGVSDVDYDGTAGETAPVVDTDYTIAVYKDAGVTDLAGLPEFGVGSGLSYTAPNREHVEVTSVFSGTGYFPAPGPGDTKRTWAQLRASLMGGVVRDFGGPTKGSVVSSYARYDVGQPDGLDHFTIHPAVEINAAHVDITHGFCVRLLNIADYVGVKITTEEVLYEMDGVTESGLFGAPTVTTHDFTSDDYTAADVGSPPPGCFVTADAGGVTVFGLESGVTNDQIGSGGNYDGYDHGTDHELYRVTVALIDAGANEYVQWQDIFPAMLIRMTVGA